MRGFNQENNMTGVWLRRVPLVAGQKAEYRQTSIRQVKRVTEMR